MAKTSPLRYPGGKARLFKYFQRLIQQNNLYDCLYVEPFCGGAALAIELLNSYLVGQVHINDLDRAIYAFWHSVVEFNDELCTLVECTPVTMDTWHACRETYRNAHSADLLALGFATFFLNRTNRSGILNAGVIGGLEQKGEWKLDARYNKEDLLLRLRDVGRWQGRVTVTQLDARDLLRNCAPHFGPNTLIYLDPPYVEKGPRLYLNAYIEKDHRELAEDVRQLACPWIVSYDAHPLVTEMYSGFREQDMRLHYSAREHSRIGREKVFFSDLLSPPDMSGIRSNYRIPWATETGEVFLNQKEKPVKLRHG